MEDYKDDQYENRNLPSLSDMVDKKSEASRLINLILNRMEHIKSYEIQLKDEHNCIRECIIKLKDELSKMR